MRERGKERQRESAFTSEPVCMIMQGLIPGLHRQFIFTGLRLGLYEHVRDLFAGSHTEASITGRIAAALCTSALGITAANPSDVVKVGSSCISQLLKSSIYV